MTTAASPIDPIIGVLEAFKSHNVIALCDGGHGCEQAYAFRVSLIRDARFALVVNDIVVESGNSLYQEMMDRFVAGEDVPEDKLRQAWQNTTQPHDVWDRPVFEGLFREVREVNASLPKDRQIRILLGDPPIDWSKISSAEELVEAWNAVGDRNSCPVRIIQREVLAKQRRALVIYGGMHLLRKRLYWQAKNQELVKHQFNPLPDGIVSLLESQGVEVYSVWVPVFVDPATILMPALGRHPALRTFGAPHSGRRVFARTIRTLCLPSITRSSWKFVSILSAPRDAGAVRRHPLSWTAPRADLESTLSGVVL
ncbi:hypothetical protein BCAR13_1560006 [Paraburkholderia caribensis]|uniref:hypothetical protein n=1 Tax=Paraburkholderia caribensis TaxID=75105 RepID=UPI001CB1B4A3|nr:hypothetical protein [Paraburkholderia caribensis]CAG9205074.1 hypothetical protein BCAR13_1560006 [Paraburkholderia caribensis]